MQERSISSVEIKSFFASGDESDTYGTLPHLQRDDHTTTVQHKVPTVIRGLFPHFLPLFLAHALHLCISGILVNGQLDTVFLEDDRQTSQHFHLRKSSPKARTIPIADWHIRSLRRRIQSLRRIARHIHPQLITAF